MKPKVRIFGLLIILLFAFLIRVYRLEQLELFGDELDVGYHAYSILKTGKDYKGNLFPIYFNSFSEYRAPLFLYSAVPFVALFGLNEWGVRLTSVFWGIMDIIFLYLLVKKITREERISLLSALILTITPWHIHYSRVAFEVTLMLFLILAGSFYFIEKNFLFSSILFSLSLYTYSTAVLFTPLWVIFLTLFFEGSYQKKEFKKIILFGTFFLLLTIPLFSKVFQGTASSRFNLISIFSDQRLIDSIIMKRSDKPNSVIERIFHNKLTVWSKSILENYLISFSPQFLFLKGDPLPRHNLPGFGEFFLVLIIPFLVGVFLFFKKNKDISIKFWTGWIILAPFASSLTSQGGTHATRLFLMIPPVVIIIAYGINYFLICKNKVFLKIFTVLVFYSLLEYYHELFVHYPAEQFMFWHYGYKNTVLALKSNQGRCKKVYLNNSHEPFLIRYLFWSKTDPTWFHANFQGDEEKEVFLNIFQGFKVGDNYFGRIIVPQKIEAMRILLEEPGACYIGFQKDEIPGDWDLKKEPLEGVEVLAEITTPLKDPYIYLLSKKQ